VLRVDTDYPFDTSVNIVVHTPEVCVFPLYLRVPLWCDRFTARVNGEALGIQGKSGSFVRIQRSWSDGDMVNIDMPTKVVMTTWPRNGSVTVDRGPLSYSVRIKEEWQRCGGTEEWPEWQVLPKTAWNYGLVVRDGNPVLGDVEVKPPALQPWTVESAPVAVKALAKRIPGWNIGNDQTVEELPQSPVTSDEAEEQITLIPMGCARLRMCCLPVVSDRRNYRRDVTANT